MSMLENERVREPRAPFKNRADHIGAAAQRQAGQFSYKLLKSMPEIGRVETTRRVFHKIVMTGRTIVLVSVNCDSFIKNIKQNSREAPNDH